MLGLVACQTAKPSSLLLFHMARRPVSARWREACQEQKPQRSYAAAAAFLSCGPMSASPLSSLLVWSPRFPSVTSFHSLFLPSCLFPHACWSCGEVGSILCFVHIIILYIYSVLRTEYILQRLARAPLTAREWPLTCSPSWPPPPRSAWPLRRRDSSRARRPSWSSATAA